MGRASKYETHVAPYLDQIPGWYETLTEGQIAEKLGVSKPTFEKYKKLYPELKAALTHGKDFLIEELKETLRKKAFGYDYKEVKEVYAKDDDGRMSVVQRIAVTKHVPPDLGAIHLLLKNLDDEWRNDDKPTMDLKREQLELQKKKAEESDW